MKILNIAAGKIKPIDIDLKKSYLLNIDTSYYRSTIDEDVIDEFIRTTKDYKGIESFVNCDIIQFMEKTTTIFDRVCIYRYLEHVSFTDVLYFIYLVSTIVKKNGVVDIIVPDYTKLANLLLNESPYEQNFEAHNIIVTTEMLNEPNCPHASIWTYDRACYFWELEKRFIVPEKSIQENYNFDGRDIYLRFQAVRQ